MSKNNQRGFSLIEILMVLILIAVLAAIAINAFVNFRREAREAAIKADLHVLRTAIATQYGQMQLRCGTNPGTFPDVASINANNIADGNSTCVPGNIPTASEAQFVQGSIPIPPTGTSATVTDCTTAGGAACTRADATGCGGGAGVFTKTWCYNKGTGEIWLDDDSTDAAGASYESY